MSKDNKECDEDSRSRTHKKIMVIYRDRMLLCEINEVMC